MNRPELRQRIIEILAKPLKVPYQQDTAEMMVQGAINQTEEILALIPDIEEAKKQERIATGEYFEHCHLSSCETHRLISIHDIERLKTGQNLKGG